MGWNPGIPFYIWLEIKHKYSLHSRCDRFGAERNQYSRFSSIVRARKNIDMYVGLCVCVRARVVCMYVCMFGCTFGFFHFGRCPNAKKKRKKTEWEFKNKKKKKENKRKYMAILPPNSYIAIAPVVLQSTKPKENSIQKNIYQKHCIAVSSSYLTRTWKVSDKNLELFATFVTSSHLKLGALEPGSRASDFLLYILAIARFLSLYIYLDALFIWWSPSRLLTEPRFFCRSNCFLVHTQRFSCFIDTMECNRLFLFEQIK